MRCTGAVWLHSVVVPAMVSPLYRPAVDSVPPPPLPGERWHYPTGCVTP